MGEKEWEPETVFDVFGDALARRILLLTSERSLSAKELTDRLDASAPTVYRRVNALGEYDLVTERIELDEEGNQHKVFETALRRIEFEIEDGGYAVDVQMRQSLVDHFESFWSDLESSSSTVDLDVEDRIDGPATGVNHE